MSSQSNTPKNNEPNKNGPPERFQPKVLVIWLVIIVAIIALMYSTTPEAAKRSGQISIAELIEAVKNEQVDLGKGEMKPDPSLGRD
ncbi:MAG: cell division protein FtsH, partial [Coraliomargarita sp.]